jgi:hypothetical protein
MKKGHAYYTGTAGEMILAGLLSYRGLHVAPTRGGAPFVDLLVSSENGKKLVGIQVKTTEAAGREQGPKHARYMHHYDWAVGRRVAMDAPEDLLVALVDLKLLNGLPDFYLVPVSVIRAYFTAHIQNKGKEPSYWRYMPRPEELEPRRNDLSPLLERLKE